MSAAPGQQELQQLSEEIQQVSQQIEALEAEVETLRAEQSDIDDAIAAINRLETDATVQVPLGGGAHVRAQVQDIEEILVEIGGDYVAERDRDGAVETLEHKKDTLDDRIDDLHDDIAELEEESDRLEQQAQQLQQQLVQQQMQGRTPESDE
ncbi:MAG: prefoldin subunit alpha [Salinarchaeum sp.]